MTVEQAATGYRLRLSQSSTLSPNEMKDRRKTFEAIARYLAGGAFVALLIWVPALVSGLNRAKGPSGLQWMLVVGGFLTMMLLAILAFGIQATSDIMARRKQNRDNKFLHGTSHMRRP